MTPNLCPWKVFSIGCGEEPDYCVTIARFVYFWFPKTLVGTSDLSLVE
jgi:hypothetical protein